MFRIVHSNYSLEHLDVTSSFHGSRAEAAMLSPFHLLQHCMYHSAGDISCAVHMAGVVFFLSLLLAIACRSCSRQRDEEVDQWLAPSNIAACDQVGTVLHAIDACDCVRFEFSVLALAVPHSAQHSAHSFSLAHVCHDQVCACEFLCQC